MNMDGQMPVAEGPEASDPNPLMPGGGPSAPPSGPFDEIMPGLTSEADGLSAKYDKLMKADTLLRTTRQQLDALLKMGDVVTVDDVIEGAGQLVAAGIDPLAMASMLADMPATGGPPALAAWIGAQDQQVKQRETQLHAVTQGVRHQLGLAGMRLLMGHAYAEQAQAPMAAPNALAPEGSLV